MPTSTTTTTITMKKVPEDNSSINNNSTVPTAIKILQKPPKTTTFINKPSTSLPFEIVDDLSINNFTETEQELNKTLNEHNITKTQTVSSIIISDIYSLILVTFFFLFRIRIYIIIVH